MAQESWSENSTGILQKTIKISKMNDTYAVWKQILKKKSNQPKPQQDQLPRFVTSNDISVGKNMKDKVKKNDVKGLTLDEYFKAREQIQQQSQTPIQTTRINEQNQEQFNIYFNEKFQNKTIHESQETKHIKVQTPNFNQQTNIKELSAKKKINNKKIFRATKLKTQTCDNKHLIKNSSKSRNKSHFQTVTNKQTIMLTTFHREFDKKVIHTQKHESSPQRFFKKKTFIKGQNLTNVQATDVSFVTKHANKFNIDRDLKRQLILDQLRS